MGGSLLRRRWQRLRACSPGKELPMTSISIITPAPAVTCFCRGRAERKPLVFQGARSKSLHNGSTAKRRDVFNSSLRITASLSEISRNCRWPGSAPAPTIHGPHEAVRGARRRSLPLAQRHRHADSRGVDARHGGAGRSSSSGYRNGRGRDPAPGARVARAGFDARDPRARPPHRGAPQADRAGGLRPLRVASPAAQRALSALLATARGGA